MRLWTLWFIVGKTTLTPKIAISNKIVGHMKWEAEYSSDNSIITAAGYVHITLNKSSSPKNYPFKADISSFSKLSNIYD